MALSDFIISENAQIMDEFEAFATQQLPASDGMDVEALRDHASQVLAAIALDMRQPQTDSQQREKSLGHAPRADGMDKSAAELHGQVRASSGFNVSQTAAEYRALRASVIRLWMESSPTLGREEVIEPTRFNEAMDEALAASLLHFATEAARMRNLFLGVLSHELRTPLPTVMTSTQSIVLAAQSGKAMPQAAERSLRGARRTQSLLDDLLDYVRSGLGEGMRVTPSPIDMGQACGRLVAELRANHPQRAIEAIVDGDPSCACDEHRIGQAISNLLVNAVRYGAPGTPVVARVDGSARDEIAVSVRNQGPAIPKETLESLFEPLVRGEEANREGYNLGLGLYNVREIALAYRGSASVESDASSGTVFTIRMPRDASAVVEAWPSRAFVSTDPPPSCGRRPSPPPACHPAYAGGRLGRPPAGRSVSFAPGSQLGGASAQTAHWSLTGAAVASACARDAALSSQPRIGCDALCRIRHPFPIAATAPREASGLLGEASVGRARRNARLRASPGLDGGLARDGSGPLDGRGASACSLGRIRRKSAPLRNGNHHVEDHHPSRALHRRAQRPLVGAGPDGPRASQDRAARH